MDIKKPRSPWGILVFGLVFSAFSCLITVGMKQSIEKQKYANQHYQQVSGTVLSSRVDYSSSGSGSSKTTSYTPEIEYEYYVNGERYESDRYWYTGSNGGEDWADRIVKIHPKGSEIIVYFDPDKPSEVVIDKSWPPENMIWAVISIFIFMGLFFVGIGIRRLLKHIAYKRRAV